MKKIMSLVALFSLLLFAGCSSSSNIEFSIDTAPKYKAGVSYPIVIKILKDGEPAEGANISALLEMSRMDHGTIEASFTDNGNGYYESSIELPMGGEWIANIEGDLGEDSFEEVITFEVVEE